MYTFFKTHLYHHTLTHTHTPKTAIRRLFICDGAACLLLGSLSTTRLFYFPVKFLRSVRIACKTTLEKCDTFLGFLTMATAVYCQRERRVHQTCSKDGGTNIWLYQCDLWVVVVRICHYMVSPSYLLARGKMAPMAREQLSGWLCLLFVSMSEISEQAYKPCCRTVIWCVFWIYTRVSLCFGFVRSTFLNPGWFTIGSLNCGWIWSWYVVTACC